MNRGMTIVEAMVVSAVILVLVAAIAPPAYRSYAASRASTDAAATLAADLALLAESAKNSSNDEGATLVIDSANPLAYTGFLGRPKSVDPNAKLGQPLMERSFPGVTLSGGPIDPETPLLFANNGSAQYESGGSIASQHETIRFTLTSVSGGRTSVVQLDLYTGAVQIGS